MRISEIAARTGLSLSTIRYYERSGLSPQISRGPDGRRAFTPRDLDWFELLASLRATGMPLSDMQAFATLYASGDATVPLRKAVLMRHRESLKVRQAELDRCRALLDRKLQLYEDILGKGA